MSPLKKIGRNSYIFAVSTTGLLAVGSLLFLTQSLADRISYRGCALGAFSKLFNSGEEPSILSINLEIEASLYFPENLSLINGTRTAKIKPIRLAVQKLMGRKLLEHEIARHDFLALMQPDQLYNIVIQNRQLTISKTGNDFFKDLTSKHVVLAGEIEPVLFSGQIWLDDQKTVHVTNNSGSYRPSQKLLPVVANFLKDYFKLKKIKTEAHTLQ